MFYFDNNPIKRIEAGFYYSNKYYIFLSFANCQIEKIDPSFFNGLVRIDFLGLVNNTCIDRNFFGIKPSNVEMVKSSMSKCFDNFENPEDPVPTRPILPTTPPPFPTTSEPNCVEDKPKLICKYNADSQFYHCEADFKRVTFIED
jgi:hypothetical protein